MSAQMTTSLLSVRSLCKSLVSYFFSRKWDQSTGQPAHSPRVQGVDSGEDNFQHQVSDRGANIGVHARPHPREHTCAVLGLSARALCVISMNITVTLRSTPSPMEFVWFSFLEKTWPCHIA